jgi:hypothetical protein
VQQLLRKPDTELDERLNPNEQKLNDEQTLRVEQEQKPKVEQKDEQKL